MSSTVWTFAQAATPAAPSKQAPTFTINEFDVYGSSVVPRRDIERAVYPFLGANRTGDTVRQAAQAIEKVYRDEGYGTVYVDIPEQTVTNGVVDLRVTEGRLERVTIGGAHFFSEGQILRDLPSLAVGGVPHLPDLQRELTTVNSRSADRAVVPVLKAGDTPGTVAVNLDVRDRLPLHGSLEVNDRYTADTAHQRVVASLSYDNFFGHQDTLSLQAQTAPSDPRNAEVGELTFLLRPAHGNSVWATYAIYSNSNVAALGTLSVVGRGVIAGERWIEPLSATAKWSSNISFGGEYKHFSQAILITSSSGITTPITYVNWSGQYAVTHTAGRSVTALNFGVNFGVRNLLNDPVQFEDNRYQARPNYAYLRGGVQTAQPLPLGMSLFMRLGGQWTGGPLVSSEQYTLGGLDTVRAYLEAEALGDKGGSGTLEARSPPLGALLGRSLRGLYGYGFIDAGAVSVIDALPRQTQHERLWSMGAGMRLESPTGWSGELDAADPRADGPRTHQGDWRVDFEVRYGF